VVSKVDGDSTQGFVACEKEQHHMIRLLFPPECIDLWEWRGRIQWLDCLAGGMALRIAQQQASHLPRTPSAESTRVRLPWWRGALTLLRRSA